MRLITNTDQSKATIDIKEDMEKEIPMDRLICATIITLVLLGNVLEHK